MREKTQRYELKVKLKPLHSLEDFSQVTITDLELE